MPYEGTGPFYLRTESSSSPDTPGNDGRLGSSAQGAGNQGVASFGTNTATRWIKLPWTGTETATATPGPADVGWEIFPADFDATVNLPCDRVIPAGNIVVQGHVNATSADATSNAFVRAYVSIKNETTGAFTQIATGDSATFNPIVGNLNNWTLNANLASRTVIPSGSSLHVSLFINGRGVAVTGQSFTLRRTGDGATDALITLPGAGLRYHFIKAASDSTAGTDSVVRQTAQARSIADAVSGADSSIRGIFNERAIADVVTGTDVATRRTVQARATADTVTGADASGRVAVYPRATADTVTGGDVVVRGTTVARSTVDTVTGADAATRQAVQFRSTADAVVGTDMTDRQTVQARDTSDAVAGVDVATRQAVQARSTSDAVTGTDALTRVVAFPRATADAVTGVDVATQIAAFNRSVADAVTGTDFVARQTVQARATADAVTGADAVMRQTTQLRSVADTVTGTDTANRVAVQVRATSDAVTGADSVVRQTVQVRAAADTVTGSDDASRQIIYGRYTHDGRGDYPIHFSGRHISGVVINHETGAPLTEAVALVSLVREFGGPSDPSQDMTVQTTVTSVADGSFSFPRDFFDDTPYHFTTDFTLEAVAYHGISDRGLIPELD